MWFLLLIPFLAAAQTDVDLAPIQDLESILPDHEIRRDAYRNIPFERKNREFRPPVRKVTIEEIKSSNVTTAFIKKGSILYSIKDNKPFRVSKEIFVKRYLLEDEFHFVYLQNKDKTTVYKTHADNIESIETELSLYEPPQRFSPVGTNVVRSVYDKKLRMNPEAALYVGVVQSSFVRDLFNDPKARSGVMNQYAFHYFTEWNFPFKVGASVHYERSSYKLARGGNVFYDALSFGPQFRTKDFDLFETNWRLTTQIRVSPYAKMQAETVNGNVDFKFNSTDLMTTAEHPWSNRWGQFVVGAFHQIQWLNLKDQREIVSVRASNKANQGFGLFLSQVFQ